MGGLAYRFRRFCLAVVCLGALGASGIAGAGQGPAASDSRIPHRELTNGVRLVFVNFPQSTNVSIFTFVPMGLTSDGPHQAQWAHLVEHLVFHSASPAPSLREANAETLPDHMRLDFYGNRDNWKRGLACHRQWLEATHFSEQTLADEKPKVIEECDFAAKNRALHKFATAAWNQGRLGETNALVKGDVMRATLAEVQEARRERFAFAGEVTVCIVGGLDANAALAAAEAEFGGVQLKRRPEAERGPMPANVSLTWDLPARHLLVTWPIPEPNDPDFASLMVAGFCLSSQLNMDFGGGAPPIFAGVDLKTPSGRFFYLSTSLEKGGSMQEVRRTLLERFAQMCGAGNVFTQAPFLAGSLARQCDSVPTDERLRSQSAGAIGMAMLEANAGLQIGMNYFRYGTNLPGLIQNLKTVNAGAVQKAVQRWLPKEKAAVCALSSAHIQD